MHSATMPIAGVSDARRSEVLGKAVSKAAELLGLTNAILGRVLGLSEASASRLRSGAFKLQLDTKPYELALLLVRLFRGLDAIVGGEEDVLRSWMNSSNYALNGVPRELIQTVQGLVATLEYVDAARARV